MKEYVNNIASKPISWYLAIKQIRGIKLKAMYQLYSTIVISISDYAVSTWYKPKTSYPLLDQVQRLG